MKENKLKTWTNAPIINGSSPSFLALSAVVSVLPPPTEENTAICLLPAMDRPRTKLASSFIPWQAGENFGRAQGQHRQFRAKSCRSFSMNDRSRGSLLATSQPSSWAC